MSKKCERVLPIVAALLLFLGSGAPAQIAVLTKPVSGRGVMYVGPEWGGYGTEWVYPGTSPDYSFAGTLQSPYSEYTGAISGGQGGISGWLKLALTPEVTNMKATSNASHAFDAFAEVVPGSKVKVKFIGNAAISWKGDTNDLWGNAGFSFDALNGEDRSGSLYRVSYPDSYELSPIINGSYSTVVQPPSVPTLAENGKTYYKLGTFSFGGSNEVFSPVNEELRFSYGASVSGIEAYYVGNALTIVDGNNQTWFIGKELPKALVVRVADGETGAPVSGVHITFTIQDPANGVKFPDGQTSITDVTESGLAAANLTLGSEAGNYTIKATCPADVCTSGVKEVLFTEKAITTQDATKLTEMFCDGAHFYGQKLNNPLRVKALNLYTNEGVSNLAVTFRPKAGSPEGTIHTENATTGPNGLASTDFTLGSALGTYTVIANCAQCLAGPTVECLVRGMYPPNAKHDSPEVGLDKRRRGVNIAVAPEEVYPQGTNGSPVESIVTIAGASPNTSFTAQVVAGANTGGHQHHDAGRPKGTLVGWDGTICTGPSPITCTTAQNGSAKLKYISGPVGGWDNILVKMATSEEGDAIIKVRVPDLVPLPIPHINYTYATKDGNHPNNLYGKPELIAGIQQIAQAYKTKYNAKISINDMSLINGGMFDVKIVKLEDKTKVHIPWVTPPHQCHRVGMSVDFNRGYIDSEGNWYTKMNIAAAIDELLAPNSIDCRRIVESDPTLAHFECPKTSTCH